MSSWYIFIHFFSFDEGVDVKSPGESCGNGLTKEVAEQLGLVVGTPVGASIIDAHAGVLGQYKYQ